MKHHIDQIWAANLLVDQTKPVSANPCDSGSNPVTSVPVVPPYCSELHDNTAQNNSSVEMDTRIGVNPKVSSSGDIGSDCAQSTIIGSEMLASPPGRPLQENKIPVKFKDFELRRVQEHSI